MKRTMLLLAGALSFMATVAGAERSVPPRREKALLDWLKTGTYRASYTAEPEVHVSLPVCTGCHRSGVDFLRSEFRP